MKQDKSLFLCATMASILALYNVESYAVENNVKCSVGQMLPLGYRSCISCSDKNLKTFAPNNNSDSLYCPGGKFVVNSEKTQGIKVCSSETLADSKHKQCIKPRKNIARKAIIPRAVSTKKPILQQQPVRVDSALENKIVAELKSQNVTGSLTKTMEDKIKNVASNKFKVSGLTNNQVKEIYDKLTQKPQSNIYIDCKEGKYLPLGKNACADCLDGYYCEGGKWTPNPSMDQGMLKCASGLVSNSNRTKCVKPETKEKSIQCNSGKYLPADKESCSACKNGYICPGGSFTKSSKDQGLQGCAYGEKPNKSNTACLKSISCGIGKYLPMAKTTCEDCLDGYYCPSGKWFPEESMNQGMLKCAEGMIPNEAKNACIKKGAIDCKPGEYLPANTEKCQPCAGANKYCPGIGGKRSEFDQGIYTCPDPSVPNSKKTSCVITLSRDFMQYGPGGKTVAMEEQCWTDTDVEEYKRCMFGNKIVLP